MYLFSRADFARRPRVRFARSQTRIDLTAL
jgi:hypothetical protein